MTSYENIKTDGGLRELRAIKRKVGLIERVGTSRQVGLSL
jgi:hypothetical protein